MRRRMEHRNLVLEESMSRIAKKSQPRVAQVALKDRLKIGRALAASMEPLATLQECADEMGMSYQAVQKIEALALFKVSMLLKAEHAKLREMA